MKMKLNLTALSVSLIYLALVSSGCTALTDTGEAKKYYVIEFSRSAEPVKIPSDKVLKVMRFDSTRSYRGHEFIYKVSDNQYESDYYNKFFISPVSMISEQTRQWLSDSGMFKGVVDQSSSVDADYYLEAYISKLHADFTGTEYLAIIEIQFVVLDYRSEMPAMVFSGSYESNVPLKHNTPQEIVTSYNKAGYEILARLEKDLQANLF